MHTPDNSNLLFNLAFDMLGQSRRNIFLTGKAGTGKTTFLRYIQGKLPKQMAIVAPTGVAAINAGGVTIHSFFQLPLSPFVPDGPGVTTAREEFVNAYGLVSRLRILKEKQKILQQLELLVIDEVSMVRADTLDAVDTVLRHVRQRPQDAFGGVQVLFIGDMFQLPPVVKEDTWDVLRGFYASPYFFDSRALRDSQPVYIEFDKIYRQSDPRFIDLLNQVRNNELGAGGMEILESLYQPVFKRHAGDGYITLTTHNEQAREINGRELLQLDSGAISFSARIEGEFPESAFPADEILVLKPGAQVMFIKNDPDRARRYFNGKIGVVSELDDERIVVDCMDGSPAIEVEREKWENIRYALNPTTRKMEQDLLGSFSQYPLRLAWAITIHKSQGLTFDRAIIDAGRSFASGQVYVALSRCRTLDGLVLLSRVSQGSFFTDRRIVEFSLRRSSSAELQVELGAAKLHYQQHLLLDIFDFGAVLYEANQLQAYIETNSGSFSAGAAAYLLSVVEQVYALNEVGDRFRTWLGFEFRKEPVPGEAGAVAARLYSSAGYFRPRLTELLSVLTGSAVSTDSRLHAREYNDAMRDLFAQLSLKLQLVSGMTGSVPAVDQLLEVRNSFLAPPFSVNAYGGPSSTVSTSRHPVLYQQLRKVRDQICSRKELPLYLVAGTKSIEEMADFLPLTNADLLRINGFGEAKVKAYGDEFLSVIQAYCSSNGLETAMEAGTVKEKKPPATKRKGSTRLESLAFFKEGLTVPDIAAKRGLTVQTVESHLASSVANGELNVESLLPREKLLQIESVLERLGDSSISIIKQELDESFGFGDIRITMAWQEFKRSHPGS
ncbi:MAG: ATP-dependent DNA helicase UvrD2 [Chitinophagaceae bacterium]|nr:MAG: ATP-dependent DNA helicase UvrD2 [Chitinophagaceae bacterium]